MKNSLNLMLLASLIIAQSAYAECQSDNNLSATKNLCCKPAKEHKPKKSCNDCHVITAKDFKKHGKLSKTVVIDQPGKWCLGESIVFDPTAQNQSAIIIDADNVRLDLCGNTLSQVEGSTVAGVSGVELAPNHQNITVTNGTIELFTKAGVYAFMRGNLLGSPLQTLRDLNFENLNVFDNGGLGNPALGLGYSAGIALATDFPAVNFINAVPSFDFPRMYYDVHISNCAVNNNTVNGTIILQCDNLSIEDSELNGTYVDNLPGSLNAFVIGIYLILVENARIINSTANFTESFATGANAARLIVGIAGITVRNLFISSSQFNNTSGEAPLVAGGGGNYLPGLFIENTQFNNVTGTGSTNSAKGFHMSDSNGQERSADGLKLVNCQFNNITVPATNTNPAPFATGLFLLTAKDVLIDSCQTAQVSNLKPLTGPGQITIAAGMLISSAPTGPTVIEVGAMRNTRIVNCQVSDIFGTALVSGISQSASNLPGFPTAPGKLQATLIDNCVISGITTSSPLFTCAGVNYSNTGNGAFQLGLDTRNHCVKNTRISNVVRTVPLNPIAGGVTAGIYSEDVIMPNFQGNNISNTVNGIVLVNHATHNITYTVVEAEVVNNNVATLTFLVDAASLGFVVGQNVTVSGFAGADAAHFNSGPTPILSVTGNSITYTAPLNGDYIAVNPTAGRATINLVSGPAHGVITENCVDNCTSAGYRDVGTIGTSNVTTSMWTKNQAFNNGTNYAINWGAITPPLAVGSISGGYPTAPEADNEWYNLDLSL